MNAPSQSRSGSGTATARNPCTPRECLGWMRTLEQQRSRLLADSDLLADEAASDPSSTRDGGKQAIEVAIGAREDVQVTVQLIDAALAKLAGLGAVPYGICEETGEPIERERLDLMPWTPVSVRGARLRGR